MFCNEYKRLLKFLKPHLGIFGAAVVCMVVSALFDGVSLGMLVPLSDKVMTNKPIIIPAKIPPFLNDFIGKINNLEPLALLNIMVPIVLILLVLKAIFGFLQSYLMTDVGQKVIKDIRGKIYAKLQTFSLDYYSKKRSGELISRITNDVKMVENALSYGIYDLVYQMFQVIVFVSVAFFIYLKLAILSFVVLPLIILPILKVGKKLRKISLKSQEKMADINSLLFETISGVRIVKAFAMEDYELNKFTSQNRDFYKLTMKSAKRMLLLSPGTELVGAAAGLFVFYFAGQEVIKGELSFGVFALFLGSILSTIRPFKKLSQVNSLLQQALAANGRIYEVLDTVPIITEKKDALELAGIKTGVEFENVWFKYEDRDILKNISLKVKSGEIAAIVGPSGAGKSTFLDLLLRFYDPYKGRILIDGIDIKDLKISSLRNKIGIVTQETILFNDSVKANIAYGNINLGIEAIERAARQAFAHDFIMNMPDKYETIIGDRGFKLSGGEKQRIAIARAILKNPPILLLDEATSQLDSHAEKIVQEAIDVLMRDRTVFVVAHRLSTVKNVSKIVVVSGGEIVESGRHEELLSRDGLYRKMYSLQNAQAE
ncbi:MAG: hypothetical protein COV72_06000 [Candidatus Omnitrophica bacterium CG11_big_fil_rev_8_21_14_0_20_42_13]|uniref:ABC transporter ATP-binding protein n=1 Tax=Candidatus Ghiorseimicrobium undicola TaxID=1974746 RepID=A0A2H0LZB2_9BACT|nr:MAG: hypothetical protein COV72_06000 [Candidatus Omnitrophica bacterium CG11_big_fil_rev_8_21_14_0_20_42_13]